MPNWSSQNCCSHTNISVPNSLLTSMYIFDDIVYKIWTKSMKIWLCSEFFSDIWQNKGFTTQWNNQKKPGYKLLGAFYDYYIHLINFIICQRGTLNQFCDESRAYAAVWMLAAAPVSWETQLWRCESTRFSHISSKHKQFSFRPSPGVKGSKGRYYCAQREPPKMSFWISGSETLAKSSQKRLKVPTSARDGLIAKPFLHGTSQKFAHIL